MDAEFVADVRGCLRDVGLRLGTGLGRFRCRGTAHYRVAFGAASVGAGIRSGSRR